MDIESNFIAAQTPTPKLPEPQVTQPQGPSEVDLLRQELQGLKAQNDEMRSHKDSKINEMKQQLELLNTTLQDKLSSRPAPVAQNTQENNQYVDNLWDSYLGVTRATSTPQTPQKAEEAVDPEEFRKVARKEAKSVLQSEVQSATEKMEAAKIKAAELAQKYQTQYTHLHHASHQITELYNSIAEANPKLTQEDLFNRTMKTAEKLFPPGQAQSAPSFPSGGQMSSQSVAPDSRQMIRGLPIRDASVIHKDVNDYVLDRKQAFNSRIRRV